MPTPLRQSLLIYIHLEITIEWMISKSIPLKWLSSLWQVNYNSKIRGSLPTITFYTSLILVVFEMTIDHIMAIHVNYLLFTRRILTKLTFNQRTPFSSLAIQYLGQLLQHKLKHLPIHYTVLYCSVYWSYQKDMKIQYRIYQENTET